MPSKLHQNTFEGGLNKDIDRKNLSNNQYVEAFSITLTKDGKQTNPTPINGTTYLQDVIAQADLSATTDAHILNSFRSRIQVNGVDKEGIIIFAYTAKAPAYYNVYAYDINADDLYLLYKETITLADKDKFIDGVIFRENGVDFLYYTDYESPIKKIPCNTKTALAGNTTPVYIEEQINLIRKGFRGEISSVAVDTGNGGDLLCGTYQFAYRLLHNVENRYTKWTLLSAPVPINIEATTTRSSYGGVGYVSTSDITLTLATEENYSSIYTHYQVAVVENIDGTEAPTVNVKILKPQAIFASTTTYNYKTNKRAQDTVSIDELTIDDAAIEAVKSLTVKNNRLIAGNVKYRDLDYDNDDPVVGSTTAPVLTPLTGEEAVGYRVPDNAANKVGYFRDELYRFGVVYEDEFGNFSKPKVLDFSNLAAGNNKAGAGIDFKFPDRGNGKYGPLLDSTSGDINALGLGIKGLANHPSWAKKVHIVRVPRKKKILFQSPYIPSILIQPARAEGNYPIQPEDASGTILEELNVEAANPEGTYAPKNFFHVLPKNLLRYGDFYGTISTLGGLYGTHDITSGVNQYVPAAVNETLTALDGYTIYPSDSEAGPYYRADGVESDLKVRFRDTGDTDPPVGFRDIEVADNVDVIVKSRAIGGTTFGTTVVTHSQYQTSANTISGLDFTVNDYLVIIQTHV